MTAPASVALPDPGFPMMTRMVCDPFFPPEKGSGKDKDEPITWTVGQAHPLIPTVKIVRMFIDRGGVEIYAVTPDGKAGMRNLVPMDRVRFTEEAMPIEVFVDELAAAENDDDDEPEEPEAPATETVQSNGLATVS